MSYLCIPYVCVVKGLITCTPYICVIKGSPVHCASVSLRGYLCTPYICVIKGLPVHHRSMSLRGYLCTPYVCVVKGSPVRHTSVSLRGFYFSRNGYVIYPMLWKSGSGYETSDDGGPIYTLYLGLLWGKIHCSIYTMYLCLL